MLLVLEVREYRSGEYAFKDFSSDGMEAGWTGSGSTAGLSKAHPRMGGA